MAKTQKRRKKNFRLRRSVRRTLGALFLMTAIIVAAIPFPDATATEDGGVPVAQADGNIEAKTDYEYKTPQDEKISFDGLLLDGSQTPKEKALIIRQGSDGRYMLYDQFDFCTVDYKGVKYGYITKYNNIYATETVNLTPSINKKYYTVTEEQYKGFFETGVGSQEKVLDPDNQKDAEFFEKYFSNEYKTYLTQYDTYQKEVQTNPGAAKPSLKKIPAKDLNDNVKLDYYCYEKIGNHGYKLEFVNDKTTTGGSTSSTDNFIYAARGGNPPSGKVNDNLGFLVEETASIIAIGKGAFTDVSNVRHITLPPEIKFVADEAFMGSFIISASLEGVESIGNRAFKGSTQLTNVNLKYGSSLGAEAFEGCTNLSQLSLPWSMKLIGAGAFANCTALSNVDLGIITATDASIGAGAFYNCPLGNLSFGATSVSKIGEGAFACTDPAIDKMKSIDMSTSNIGELEDKVFAGRTYLETVVMPGQYGSTKKVELPKNIFARCSNLNLVKFPDHCGLVEYKDNTIFHSVVNNEIVVEGPYSDNYGVDALERKATWNCLNGNEVSVPYSYIKDGKTYFEVKSTDYLLTMEVDKGNKTAILTECKLADPTNPPTSGNLDIPDNVGIFQVVKLNDGCIAEDVKKTIKNLTVGNSIKEIGASVFENCGDMQSLVVGNGVTTIGANAFKNCTSLENAIIGSGVTSLKEGVFEGCSRLETIEFKSPLNGHGSFPENNIGTNALRTGGNKLTIIGDVQGGYGPFDYAMNPDNYVNSELGIRICYKSPEPTKLTVILDNRNNLPTLVDYPKYEDLKDIKVKEVDESGNETTTDTDLKTKYESGQSLTPAEQALVNSTLLVEIPAGVKSIDVKGYLTDTSKQTVGDSGKVIQNSYSVATYFNNKNNDYKYLDEYKKFGLFNGTISDSITEEEERGDDNLLGVVMHTVEYLPTVSNDELSALGEEDYAGGAFYSCENLQRVDLGSAMQDVGSLPFLDCVSLNEVDASKTATYKSDNKILYNTITEAEGEEGKEPVSGLEIVEVLHTRGSAGDADVNTTADALLSDVVQIAPGAFMNTNVGTVDLTGTPDSLRVIPEDCFKDNEGLVETVLPPNIRIIRDGAFENTAENTTVIIKGKEVDIKNEAFKNNKAIVRTYKDTAAYNAALGIPGVTVKPLDDMFRVVFYNSVTGEVIKTEYVEEGDRAQEPEGEEIPVNPGMVFDKWSTDEYRNVTQDLVVLALYKSDGTGSDGTGGTNKPGEGNDGVQVPGGTDINGDGIPDYDENGNRLYTLTVSNGTGGGRYPAGKRVAIQAGAAPDGAGFTHWSSTNTEVIFNDATKASTTLTMPASDTTVVCNFAGYYRLDVIYGSGSGSYPAGAKVEIKAVDAPQGRSFASWKSSTSGLTIENSRKQTTTVTMPKNNATVTATYMDNGSISGNSANKNSGNKTQIQITKPGIPNTDKASAYVSGSSDGFIVKISESAEATDAVQKALQAKYPDMTRVKYFAMDISLYDATGTRKITDTTGLKINITIPIPEALKEYAGNNKIAAVVNGQIEDLAPKFVTIDGVPCISFTATHFSPYTVYVDTANLTVTNTLDATPKTGDGIHPKWFLSLGLACISMILFLKKDKKYVTKLS